MRLLSNMVVADASRPPCPSAIEFGDATGAGRPLSDPLAYPRPGRAGPWQLPRNWAERVTLGHMRAVEAGASPATGGVCGNPPNHPRTGGDCGADRALGALGAGGGAGPGEATRFTCPRRRDVSAAAEPGRCSCRRLPRGRPAGGVSVPRPRPGDHPVTGSSWWCGVPEEWRVRARRLNWPRRGGGRCFPRRACARAVARGTSATSCSPPGPHRAEQEAR